MPASARHNYFGSLNTKVMVALPPSALAVPVCANLCLLTSRRHASLVLSEILPSPPITVACVTTPSASKRASIFTLPTLLEGILFEYPGKPHPPEMRPWLTPTDDDRELAGPAEAGFPSVRPALPVSPLRLLALCRALEKALPTVDWVRRAVACSSLRLLSAGVPALSGCCLFSTCISEGRLDVITGAGLPSGPRSSRAVPVSGARRAGLSISSGVCAAASCCWCEGTDVGGSCMVSTKSSTCASSIYGSGCGGHSLSGDSDRWLRHSHNHTSAAMATVPKAAMWRAWFMLGYLVSVVEADLEAEADAAACPDRASPFTAAVAALSFLVVASTIFKSLAAPRLRISTTSP